MKKVLALISIAILLAGSICAVKFYLWYTDNKAANFGKEAVIYVYPDSTVESVVAQIVDSAEVINHRSLSRAIESKQVTTYMKPGRYIVKPSYSSVYVARMLNNCWQEPTVMVLSGTMRSNTAIAKKISNQMMVDSASVASALSDSTLLASYGFDTVNVFSMFLPDSYQLYWTASVEDILKRMKDAYDSFWNETRLRKASEQGLTKEQVSILASIVQCETNYEPEMPSVAGVYLNRLHKGMKLQADPTVAYCLDFSVSRILNKHLEIDSPYNTYKYAGLPPGPITVPSKACIEAVLNPDSHPYLYFCASPAMDGTHRFAVSYSEHLRNARAFQAVLNSRK